MIDFEIPEDIKELRARVGAFIDDYVLPAEKQIGTRPFLDIVKELQGKARAEGLWCPFVPKEWGGMGLGHLANAIVQIEVGRSFSHLAAWAMNCMGPQDATMITSSSTAPTSRRRGTSNPSSPATSGSASR